MNKILSVGSLVLMSIAYTSCQSPGTTTPTAQAATDAPAPAPNPHGGGGRSMPMSEITPCLEAYQATMTQYGITVDSPAKPITKCPAMTYRSTLTETLTYSSFRHFLDSCVLAMDSAAGGANLNLTIMPGICTAKFVADMGATVGRVGRISYFVTVTKIDTTGGTAAKPAGGGGGTGYEIGGIEP